MTRQILHFLNLIPTIWKKRLLKWTGQCHQLFKYPRCKTGRAMMAVMQGQVVKLMGTIAPITSIPSGPDKEKSMAI